MQFLLIAYDGTDPEAPERRLKVREEHLEKIAKLKSAVNFYLAVLFSMKTEK